MNKGDLIAETVRGRVAVELCAGAGRESVTVGGRTFTSNEDTTFVVFTLSYGLPSVTDYGFGLHPETIAKNWPTIVGKVFNYGHRMKSYDPKGKTQDRVLGTIMAAEFPERPAGGWQIPERAEDAPGIRGVAAMHRAAEDVPAMIEMHRSGELQWEVSMEVNHRYEEGAFALRDGKAWRYVNWADAPPELLACFQKGEPGKNCMIVQKFEGQWPVYLCGGVGGPLRYRGAALVEKGGEPTNTVETILAGAPLTPALSLRPTQGEGEADPVNEAARKLAAGLAQRFPRR